jgi:GH24 family phage-related lysozyme (muramidase)
MFDLARLIGGEPPPAVEQDPSSDPFFIKFEIPKPPPVPNAPIPEVLKDEDFITAARRYVRANETSGKVYDEMYKDDKGNWTIGVGHLITEGEMDRFRGRKLTEQEIEDLFTEDLNKKFKLAKSELGKTFDNLSPQLKVAVIDGFFRGDLSGSPRTLELMQAGKWTDAAVEFLNNNEYRASLAKIKSGEEHGVAPRMERIAATILAEGSKK